MKNSFKFASIHLTENNFRRKFFRGPFFRGPFFRGPFFRGPFFRGPIFRGPLFRGPFFSGIIFLGTIFPGDHFAGDHFSAYLMETSTVILSWNFLSDQDQGFTLTLKTRTTFHISKTLTKFCFDTRTALKFIVLSDGTFTQTYRIWKQFSCILGNAKHVWTWKCTKHFHNDLRIDFLRYFLFFTHFVM